MTAEYFVAENKKEHLSNDSPHIVIRHQYHGTARPGFNSKRGVKHIGCSMALWFVSFILEVVHLVLNLNKSLLLKTFFFSRPNQEISPIEYAQFIDSK